MTPEERSLLERTYKLVEENNSILRSIRRSNRVSMIMNVLYWVFIIGLSFGAFYLIQPYVNSIFGAYDQIQQSGLLDNAGSIKDLLK